MKLTKEKVLTIYKIYVAILIVMVIVLIFTTARQGAEVRHEKLLKEAGMELLMFTINVSNYCAESNNITYQELLDGYIIKMAHELISESNNPDEPLDEMGYWYNNGTGLKYNPSPRTITMEYYDANVATGEGEGK